MTVNLTRQAYTKPFAVAVKSVAFAVQDPWLRIRLLVPWRVRRRLRAVRRKLAARFFFDRVR